MTSAVSVETAAGRLRLVGLHPSVPGSPSRLASRDRQILAAARTLEAEGPGLMVGDLNATPWTTALQAVRRETGVRRVSTGLASTWFAPWPFLGIPIDHVLVTPGLRASARVGPGVGSDHMPLIVRVGAP